MLPVDLNGDGQVPEGFTGRPGGWPTNEHIAAWLTTYGDRNIGLRLPDDVLGVDVDCYDGKPGCETLRFYEQQAGPLPATWRSTARSDGSAIYLFRVPTGRRWVSNLKGIEIIRFGHRWARVWPSVSVKTKTRGWPYRWYRPDGATSDRPPRPDELAELPEAWVDALTKDSSSVVHRGGTNGVAADNGDDHMAIDFDALVAEAPDVGSGAQREHLTRVIGWMRQRGYTLISARTIAWTVAAQYRTYDPTKPWTQANVQEIVDEMWNRYEAGPAAALTPELLAWVDSIGTAPQNEPGGTGGGQLVTASVLPSTPPSEIEKKFAAEQLRQWLIRVAGRQLDAYELAAARGPRPKRTAKAYAEVPQPRTVIDDVLAAEVNLLGGPTEAGKSLLARDWCLSVASGYPWRGHAVPERRNALVVASEGLHDFRERWMTHPLWEKAADVYILDEPIDLVRGDDVSWLLNEYADVRPGLVVFDVIYGMGLPDDDGTKDVVPLIAALKKISATWGAATLALGHPGHNNERRFRGSSAWRQLAAVEWHMAEGALSCEKSKIADKHRLGAAYVAEYPWLRFPEAAETMATEAQRRAYVQADVERYPEESDRARALRLGIELRLGERQLRRLIASVKRTTENGRVS